MNRRSIWVALYAIAMAFVEAAVVVYLRALAPTLGQIPAIEQGREAATIVMLLAVAVLAGGDSWGRFLFFCLAFGIWDLFYYAWLRVLTGWPPSLLTSDVLFLIPVPWVAPVLAPVIVSLGLVAVSLWLLKLRERGVIVRFSPRVWAIALGGGALVLLSFMLDYRRALQSPDPPAFHWILFGTGVSVAVAALVTGVRRRPPRG
ncbi:MAG TPA: hypothetical protein VKP10_12330 [Gemmatimonadales bacterium]|nr:hypothetical protein [Gemmatimonadales bacterium]